MELNITNTSIEYKSINIKNRYTQLGIIDSQSNCKLSYLENVGMFLDSLDNEDKKKMFDKVLNNCRISVFLTTSEVEYKDFFLKNYEIISYSEVAIGYKQYQKPFQYHILIKNTLSFDKERLQYLKDVKSVLIDNTEG
jgi:hypothetical protein